MCSFLPSSYVVFCMLCCAFFVLVFLQISTVIMSGSKDYKNSPLKMEAIGTRKAEG